MAGEFESSGAQLRRVKIEASRALLSVRLDGHSNLSSAGGVDSPTAKA